MAKVEIYTTKLCPYCYRAKALLDKKGIPFREVDVSFDPAMRRQLVDRTGRRTVPQIFINDKSVGGYDDIAALDEEGELTRLCAASP
jgi:glutaredoxin 3